MKIAAHPRPHGPETLDIDATVAEVERRLAGMPAGTIDSRDRLLRECLRAEVERRRTAFLIGPRPA